VRDLKQAAAERGLEIPNEHIIVDPGIAPIGSDMEGITKRVLASVKLLGEADDLKGLHMSVGLSNFTIGLPSKRADGSPLKGPLESAFLTMAMPMGLDMVIGSVKRKYNLLADDDPALVCLKEVLELDDLDGLMRVQEFYS